MAVYNSKREAKQALQKHLEDDFSNKPQDKLKAMNEAMNAYANYLKNENRDEKNNVLLMAAQKKYNRELEKHPQQEPKDLRQEKNVDNLASKQTNPQTQNNQFNIQLTDSKGNERDPSNQPNYYINSDLDSAEIEQSIQQTVSNLNEQFKNETGTDQDLMTWQKVDSNTWMIMINEDLLNQSKKEGSIASDSQFNKGEQQILDELFVPKLQSDLQQKDPNAGITPNQPQQSPKL